MIFKKSYLQVFLFYFFLIPKTSIHYGVYKNIFKKLYIYVKKNPTTKEDCKCLKCLGFFPFLREIKYTSGFLTGIYYLPLEHSSNRNTQKFLCLKDFLTV